MAQKSYLPLRFFNTLSREEESFTPLTPGKVRMYCCGPTVYHYAHIGNMRAYLFEDVLVRTLRHAGYEVEHVMNITDVGHLVGDADEGEDKMLVAMRREKKTSHEIADFYTEAFFKACRDLNIVRPNVVCKATDHIAEMIELIKRIEKNGFTYVAGGNVYFDISKMADYGKLAKLDLEQLKAGARIEVDPNKRNPGDFVLWFTKSKFEGQELVWDSPWGRGYPGWHIECSAMSIKYLGEEFDIHCGGVDHVPVHHTNEIAQAEAATNKKPWVRYWMHNEWMLFNSAKMSKSAGGFITIQDLIGKGFPAASFRFFCLGSHYRSQLSFNWDAIEGATQALSRLKTAVLKLRSESAPGAAAPAKYAAAFDDAVAADLNTPRVLALVWEALADKSLDAGAKLAALFRMDSVLGLGMDAWTEEKLDIPAPVLALLEKRKQARANKSWAESDALRDEIKSLGYLVEDKGGEMIVKKAR